MKRIKRKRLYYSETWNKKKPRGWRAPSLKADNYKFCRKCLSNKFCYETQKKAETALKYSQYCHRYYWCTSCGAYHLTSESKEEYWDNLDEVMQRRYGTKAIRGDTTKKEGNDKSGQKA